MSIDGLNNLLYDKTEAVIYVQKHSTLLSYEYEENSDLHQKVLSLNYAPLNEQIEKVVRRSEIFKLKKTLSGGDDQKIQEWLAKNQDKIFRLEDLGFNSKLMLAEIDALRKTKPGLDEILTKIAISALGFKESGELKAYRLQIEKAKTREQLTTLHSLLDNNHWAEIGAWLFNNLDTLSLDVEPLGFEPLTLYNTIKNIRVRMDQESLLTTEIDEALSKLAVYAVGLKGKTIDEAKKHNIEVIAHYINANRLPLTEANLTYEQLMEIAPHLTYVDMWNIRKLNLGLDHEQFISRCINAYHIFITRKPPRNFPSDMFYREPRHERFIISHLKNLPPKLRSLHLDCKDLQTINLSNCKELVELEFLSTSQLTALNVSANPKLKKLITNSSKITTLDLSKNRELNVLDCSGNKIKSLNLSTNTVLKELIVEFCFDLSQLNVANNPLLQVLRCGYCPLMELNLTNNPLLETLDCEECRQLRALDVSNQVQLTKLNVIRCLMKTVDLSKNRELKFLDCRESWIESLDLTNNLKLETLYCSAGMKIIR